MNMFSEAVERIAREYKSLGHELGWGFLYSPANTLSTDTRIIFVGSNPGGKSYETPIESVEEGNAYRVESWAEGRKDNKLNPLQTQVCLLYEILAGKLNKHSAAELMDQTLTSNVCPFRSPNWNSLNNREDSLEFSHALWLSIFDHISPSVIICLGNIPFNHLDKVLLRKGFVNIERSKYPVGWGDVTYSRYRYWAESKGIFGRHESQEAADQLTDAIVESLPNYDW